MPLAQDSVLALGLWSLGLSALWPAALSEQSGEDRFGDGRLVLTHAGSIIPSTGIAGITPVDGIIISHKADRSSASGNSLPMYYDSQAASIAAGKRLAPASRHSRFRLPLIAAD
jgi:hypothetical protein